MFLQIQKNLALLKLEAGKANAIDLAFINRFYQLLDEFEASSTQAAVLTGYGNFFSAGLSLPTLYTLERGELKSFVESFTSLATRLLTCPRPIVSAINGHAIAGGCIIALQTDFRLMADASAKIGLNEVQLGLGLPTVGLETLRHTVPVTSLRSIALEGNLFLPNEALSLGLIDQIVPAEELEERAFERAEQLSSVPVSGYATIKRALRAPILKAVEDAAPQLDIWLDSWFSEETQERIQKVVAKMNAKKSKPAD